MSIQELFGITAGILALAAYPTYIWSIFKGSTRPNRATWWVLTLASTILAASYWAEGAGNTLWIAVAYALGNLSIAIVSLKHGDGRWGTLDKVCLIAALGSAGAWWFLDEPLIALIVNIIIDFLGIIPTVYKSYNKPLTESRQAWVMDVIASILNMVAIENWTVGIAAYPIYLLIINCLIAYLVMRSKVKKHAQSAHGRG